MRRSVIARRPLILGLLLAAVFAGGPSPASSQEKTVVPVGLVWATDGRSGFLYLGIERGFYAAEGLDVQVHRGRGGMALAIDVSQGQYPFGALADLSVIVPLRQKGSDLKGILLTGARSSFGFQSFAEKNIKTPKDFEGHSVGLQPGSMTERLFPMLAKANGVDVSKVRIVPLAGDVYVPAFLEGRIDLMSGFFDSLYQVVRFQAEKRGKSLTSVWAKDWGLDTLGSMFVAREQTLREQPDLVRRFLRASKRALDATRADPPQALAAILKHNSALNRVIAQGQLQAFLELELDAEIGAEKSGCAVEAKVQRTVDMYRQALDIAQPVPAAQVFTNEFMEWCR